MHCGERNECARAAPAETQDERAQRPGPIMQCDTDSITIPNTFQLLLCFVTIDKDHCFWLTSRRGLEKGRTRGSITLCNIFQRLLCCVTSGKVG